MSTTSPLVPVTIVGGYLGAGKTTLLNRLLAGDHGRRIAVLVNDFGAVNIDAELIAAHDGDTVTLQNGCICCSIADALGDALDAVLAVDPTPDQIIIEASGAADPAKVAHYGEGWPGCRLDAVLVLADTETIRRQVDDDFVGELVVRQLRSADVVVLTKTDLVGPATFDDVCNWVADHTAGRPTVLGASYGQIDPALVLSPVIDRSPVPEASPVETGDRFETFTVESSAPLLRARVESALRGWPDEIVRVKGIIELADSGAAVIQRVGRRWSIEPWPHAALAPQRCAVVLIGIAGAVDLEGLAKDLVTPAI